MSISWPGEAVGARLREVREDLGVVRLDEGALPERPRLGAGGELALLLLGGLALIAVDAEERGHERVALRLGLLGQELAHLLAQEVVLELDEVRREPARLDLGGERARHCVARFVLGEHADAGATRRVPGEREQRHEDPGILRAGGEGGEEEPARVHPHAGGALGPEGDEPDAPLGQIARESEDLEGGGREVQGDGQGQHRPVVDAERPPEVVARPHLEGGLPFAKSRCSGRRR